MRNSIPTAAVPADPTGRGRTDEGIPAPEGEARTGEDTKRILVVDDDPDVLEQITRIVAQVGFRTDTARDGEEGWNAHCQTAYDLIITDNEMPRLTGLNLIERMRRVSAEPPCILISGNLPGPESRLLEIVHRGAFLAKPFTSSALVEKVFGLLLHGDSAST